MANRYFRLFFEKVTKDQPSHTPASAIEVIKIRSTIDNKGEFQITNDCFTDGEIEAHITQMIEELVKIKVEAKKKYEKVNKKYRKK